MEPDFERDRFGDLDLERRRRLGDLDLDLNEQGQKTKGLNFNLTEGHFKTDHLKSFIENMHFFPNPPLLTFW